MTFGLIVARIPEAGLADAPDDALDAALGVCAAGDLRHEKGREFTT